MTGTPTDNRCSEQGQQTAFFRDQAEKVACLSESTEWKPGTAFHSNTHSGQSHDADFSCFMGICDDGGFKMRLKGRDGKGRRDVFRE